MATFERNSTRRGVVSLVSVVTMVAACGASPGDGASPSPPSSEVSAAVVPDSTPAQTDEVPDVSNVPVELDVVRWEIRTPVQQIDGVVAGMLIMRWGDFTGGEKHFAIDPATGQVVDQGFGGDGLVLLRDRYCYPSTKETAPVGLDAGSVQKLLRCQVPGDPGSAVSIPIDGEGRATAVGGNLAVVESEDYYNGGYQSLEERTYHFLADDGSTRFTIGPVVEPVVHQGDLYGFEGVTEAGDGQPTVNPVVAKWNLDTGEKEWSRPATEIPTIARPIEEWYVVPEGSLVKVSIYGLGDAVNLYFDSDGEAVTRTTQVVPGSQVGIANVEPTDIELRTTDSGLTIYEGGDEVGRVPTERARDAHALVRDDVIYLGFAESIVAVSRSGEVLNTWTGDVLNANSVSGSLGALGPEQLRILYEQAGVLVVSTGQRLIGLADNGANVAIGGM